MLCGTRPVLQHRRGVPELQVRVTELWPVRQEGSSVSDGSTSTLVVPQIVRFRSLEVSSWMYNHQSARS